MTQKMDYSQLRGRIREKCGSEGTLAEKIGISHPTLSVKLNQKFAFTSREIQKIADILGIPTEEIGRYFFTQKVKET
jgi:lambda repressor-like predicted transcriptional regulator